MHAACCSAVHQLMLCLSRMFLLVWWRWWRWAGQWGAPWRQARCGVQGLGPRWRRGRVSQPPYVRQLWWQLSPDDAEGFLCICYLALNVHRPFFPPKLINLLPAPLQPMLCGRSCIPPVLFLILLCGMDSPLSCFCALMPPPPLPRLTMMLCLSVRVHMLHALAPTTTIRRQGLRQDTPCRALHSMARLGEHVVGNTQRGGQRSFRFHTFLVCGVLKWQQHALQKLLV